MIMRIESLCTTQVITSFSGTEITRGTGFLYRFGQTLALVTNWHILSGLSPITGLQMPGCVYTPNWVGFHVSVKTTDGYFIAPISLPLQSGYGSTWLQHTGYRDGKGRLRLVDIGVVPLNSLIENQEWIFNEITAFPAQMIYVRDGETGSESAENAYARVATEVFMLRYPKGLTSQGIIPVWKRGSIASEPLFAILDGAPAFFVDALTRDGMSGAPVLSFSGEITDASGIAIPYAHNEKSSPWLLGVYAGREGVTEDEMKMTLGRAWKKQMLDDIFFYGIPGGETLGSDVYAI